MKASWQTGTGRLVCRWSGVKERIPYNAPWMNASKDVHRKNISPAFLDFTKLSPFGGSEWYARRPRSEMRQSSSAGCS
jgi:hypothetical protein